MDDYDFDFGSLDAGEGAYDISSFLGDSGGQDIDFSGFDNLDLSSLLGGDGGVDLSGLDMGPEAFDINNLVDNFDNFSLEEGQGTQDISDLFDSFSLEGGQGTQDMSDLFDSFSLEGDQGFKFDDDTEPGSSGGTQGSYGTAGSGDLGSYEGSSYTGGGGGDKKLVFDDDREPGSSGGTGGSTGVAGSGNLGSYKGSTYDDTGGTKTKVDDKGNVILPDGTKVTPGGTVTTCPSPEMLILLSSGEQRKAGDLQIGDEVKTQHETTMEWGNFKVTHAEIIPNAKRLNIKLDGKDFICSVDHKFYKDGAWVDAKDIKVGDVLSDKSVTDIAEHSTGDVVQITVDDAHTYICEGVLSHNKSPVPKTPVTPKDPNTPKTPVTPKATDKKDNNMLMMLLALMAMMNKGGGSTGSGGTIPSLQANRSQLPYGPVAGSQARPGAGGVNYFSPTSYTQKAAGGGMMYGGGGISDLGGYSDGGRLLRGPGDGVSDSIPATIGGKQPARLAEGEFVVPARVVSELGNGSTEAGAKKLYAMMDRVQKARRKTKNVAADTKAHKYLPA